METKKHTDRKVERSQTHANQQTSQQYSSNYSAEVEKEKPFKRKRKENDLDGKVLCILMRPPLWSRSSTKPRGSENSRMLT